MPGDQGNAPIGKATDKAVEIAHLLQKDRYDQIKHFFDGPWVKVRATGDPTDGLYVFACLIPLKEKQRFLEDVGWSFRSNDLQPRVECIWHGSGDRKVYYLKHGNESGAEALFHCRSHSNRWPSLIEVAEEFRLLFNLHHDNSRNVLLYCDENGSEEEVARIGANSLDIKLAFLTRYLRAKQMHLAVQFDGNTPSLRTLSELGLTPGPQVNKGENHHLQLSLTIWDNDERFRCVSRLIGKLVLPCPGSIQYEDPYAEEHRTYVEFIVAIDSEGKPVCHSCKPHGGENVPYLTPVFFKREVLQEYFNQPERYTVEDGRLCCGSLWDLQIDNDHQTSPNTGRVGTQFHLWAPERAHSILPSWTP